MKKLIPLLIVLSFVAGGLYYQEMLIDWFLGESNTTNQTQSNSVNQGPPSMPAFNFGPPVEDQVDVDLNSANEEDLAVNDNDLEPNQEGSEIDFSQLANDLESKSNESQEKTFESDVDSAESQAELGNTDSSLSGPPSLPAFNFAPPVEEAMPFEPVSEEVSEEINFLETNPESPQRLVKTPDISNQKFSNSFIKFDYPINISVLNVSLSSVDLNSIDDKLMNISFFNNADRKNVKEFVAESTSVTDFFTELNPEKIDIPGVDETYFVVDVALGTKFCLVATDNIFVMIELDLDNNFEFIEQIIIPSIKSQIL